MITAIEKDTISTSRNSMVTNPAQFRVDILQAVKKNTPFYLERGLIAKDIEELYNKACHLHAQEKYNEAKEVYALMTAYNHLDKRGWMGAAVCLQELHEYPQAMAASSRGINLTKENTLANKLSIKVLADILLENVEQHPAIQEKTEKQMLDLAKQYRERAKEIRKEAPVQTDK